MQWWIVLLLLAAPVGEGRDAASAAADERAGRLAREIMIIDAHMDVPYRLWKNPEDVSARTEKGNFDFERARAGGLDGAFMAIFTSPDHERDGTARALADSLIDSVEGLVVKSPDRFGIATSVGDVRRLRGEGKIAMMLGMENGAPLAGDISNAAYFYGRGVRYITLTHAEDNHICDSSFDDARTWNGLSPFGRTVVREMNRLGMIIDVSHASDDAFYQVLELSRAPVIASHSGCRHFTPGWERNLDDRMIEALARKGGMVCVNFGSVFVRDDCRRVFTEGQARTRRFARENGLPMNDPQVRAFWKAYREENPIGFADVSDVADHIDHIAKLVGVEHVGLGSDFDGLGDSLPEGLKDVSQYPNLIRELLERGYDEEDIEKICSGNILRVWSDVERIGLELGRGK